MARSLYLFAHMVLLAPKLWRLPGSGFLVDGPCPLKTLGSSRHTQEQRHQWDDLIQQPQSIFAPRLVPNSDLYSTSLHTARARSHSLDAIDNRGASVGARHTAREQVCLCLLDLYSAAFRHWLHSMVLLSVLLASFLLPCFLSELALSHLCGHKAATLLSTIRSLRLALRPRLRV